MCCECVNYLCTNDKAEAKQRMGRGMGSEGEGVQNMAKHAPQMTVKVRVVCMCGVSCVVCCRLVVFPFVYLPICNCFFAPVLGPLFGRGPHKNADINYFYNAHMLVLTSLALSLPLSLSSLSLCLFDKICAHDFIVQTHGGIVANGSDVDNNRTTTTTKTKTVKQKQT